MGRVRLSEILWDTAIIGRGTAAAAYAATMGPRPGELIVAIGEADPWSPEADAMAIGRGHAGAAGDPTLALNQSEYLLRHYGSRVPVSDTSNMDRYAFARHNADILARHTDKQVDRKVTGIRFGLVSDKLLFHENRVNGYIISYVGLHGAKECYARNVVVTGGAGTHRAPTEKDVSGFAEARQKHPRKILDVNQFAKLTAADVTGRTVVVLGPNAAIDAVQKALHRGYNCEIVWIVGAAQNPAVLASQQTVLDARERITYRYLGKPAMKATADKIQITIDRAPTANTVTANPAHGAILKTSSQQKILCDYFVYGVGQNGEPVKLFSDDVLRTLRPIQDKNRVFGDSEDSILGYESERNYFGTSLKVFGALSAQIGRALSTSEKAKRLKDLIEQARKEIQDHVAPLQLIDGRKPILFENLDVLMTQKRDLGSIRSQLNDEKRALIVRTSMPGGVTAAEGKIDVLIELLLKYLRFADYTAKLANPASKLSATFADGGQVKTIQAAVAAHNNFLPFKQSFKTPDVNSPSYVKGTAIQIDNSDPMNSEVNFTTYDADMLQAYIIINFPLVTEVDANGFVGRVVSERKRLIQHSPQQVAALRAELEGKQRAEEAKVARRLQS